MNPEFFGETQHKPKLSDTCEELFEKAQLFYSRGEDNITICSALLCSWEVTALEPKWYNLRNQDNRRFILARPTIGYPSVVMSTANGVEMSVDFILRETLLRPGDTRSIAEISGEDLEDHPQKIIFIDRTGRCEDFELGTLAKEEQEELAIALQEYKVSSTLPDWL